MYASSKGEHEKGQYEMKLKEKEFQIKECERLEREQKEDEEAVMKFISEECGNKESSTDSRDSDSS